MKLGKAKLCNAPECQEIFEDTVCPRCGSEGTFVGTWVPLIMIDKTEIEHPTSNVESSSAEAMADRRPILNGEML